MVLFERGIGVTRTDAEQELQLYIIRTYLLKYNGNKWQKMIEKRGK